MQPSLTTLDVGIAQGLTLLEREWLSGHLVTLRGILDAAYWTEGPLRLIIEYDADLITTMELLDRLYLLGIGPELSPSVSNRCQWTQGCR